MGNLAEVRPLFHNEADFQHAFAWQLHLENPDALVRLETKPLADRQWFVDLLVRLGDCGIALELKYLTRKLEVAAAAERYSLRNHSAHDTRRYDVVKDVARLEEIVTARAAD